MLKLAQTISAVFNPLVVVVLITVGIVYRETGSLISSSKWFFVSATFSILFALFIILSIKKGIFSNFDVSTKRQRPLLFLAGTAAVVVSMLFIRFTNASDQLMKALFLALLGIGTYQLVTSRIKASVHMGILTVFVFFLFLMIGVYALPFVVLLPLVGWARVKEKEHTMPEVFTGLGIGIVFGALLIFLLQ